MIKIIFMTISTILILFAVFGCGGNDGVNPAGITGGSANGYGEGNGQRAEYVNLLVGQWDRCYHSGFIIFNYDLTYQATNCDYYDTDCYTTYGTYSYTSDQLWLDDAEYTIYYTIVRDTLEFYIEYETVTQIVYYTRQ